MNDKTYVDEYNEPATFAEDDWRVEVAEERKTAVCDMCNKPVDPADTYIAYFWAYDERYEIHQCADCAHEWNQRQSGAFARCSVCGESCSAIGEDSLTILSYTYPHGITRRQLSVNALCQECAVAWAIWDEH